MVLPLMYCVIGIILLGEAAVDDSSKNPIEQESVLSLLINLFNLQQTKGFCLSTVLNHTFKWLFLHAGPLFFLLLLFYGSIHAAS